MGIILAETGLDVSVHGIAEFYGPLIDGIVIDHTDAHHQSALTARGLHCHVTSTIMQGAADSAILAKELIDFAAGITRRP